MINEFKGDYRFLSNFWPCIVHAEGEAYRSSEHAYMAMKTTDMWVRQQIRDCHSPADAKAMGRKIQLRDGWDGMRVFIMESILDSKFSDPVLAGKLLATGDELLVEGNWWGDKFWGICLKTNQGENHLGQCLMRVREKLRAKQVKRPTQLIIAGGRDFTDKALMLERLIALDNMGKFPDGGELICGMAKGADWLGREIFLEKGLEVHQMPADWDHLGKRAGFVRNGEMGLLADMALIFWDGQSRGTKHMIETMDRLGKPAYVVRY